MLMVTQPKGEKTSLRQFGQYEVIFQVFAQVYNSAKD